jgi:hypothetical protein
MVLWWRIKQDTPPKASPPSQIRQSRSGWQRSEWRSRSAGLVRGSGDVSIGLCGEPIGASQHSVGRATTPGREAPRYAIDVQRRQSPFADVGSVSCHVGSASSLFGCSLDQVFGSTRAKALATFPRMPGHCRPCRRTSSVRHAAVAQRRDPARNPGTPNRAACPITSGKDDAGHRPEVPFRRARDCKQDVASEGCPNGQIDDSGVSQLCD